MKQNGGIFLIIDPGWVMGEKRFLILLVFILIAIFMFTYVFVFKHFNVYYICVCI